MLAVSAHICNLRPRAQLWSSAAIHLLRASGSMVVDPALGAAQCFHVPFKIETSTQSVIYQHRFKIFEGKRTRYGTGGRGLAMAVWTESFR